jgi:hypothetical protein
MPSSLSGTGRATQENIVNIVSAPIIEQVNPNANVGVPYL